jgi:GTP cyclohydrolase II
MEHAVSPLKTAYGFARLHCYSFGPHEEDNILCVEAGDFRHSGLVRVQSACYTAEIFRSTDCDCHEQLHKSLTLIHERGGLVVYMIADGRGAGLLTKVRGLALGASEGLDTFDAYHRLGVSPDPRSYDNVVGVLRDLGVSELRLLTNNPRKIAGLEAGGLRVIREPLEIASTLDSEPYLRSKREKFGHLLAGFGGGGDGA